jgi:hypothetical protein
MRVNITAIVFRMMGWSSQRRTDCTTGRRRDGVRVRCSRFGSVEEDSGEEEAAGPGLEEERRTYGSEEGSYRV